MCEVGCVPLLEPMPLLPRWRFMTDEAKALTKRTAVSALVVLLVLMVFRALLLWVLVALVGWWVWRRSASSPGVAAQLLRR